MPCGCGSLLARRGVFQGGPEPRNSERGRSLVMTPLRTLPVSRVSVGSYHELEMRACVACRKVRTPARLLEAAGFPGERERASAEAEVISICARGLLTTRRSRDSGIHLGS